MNKQTNKQNKKTKTNNKKSHIKSENRERELTLKHTYVHICPQPTKEIQIHFCFKLKKK